MEIRFCYKHVFVGRKNFQRTGRIARTIKFHKALNNISLQIFDWVSLALKKRREKVFCVLAICLYIGKTHGTQCQKNNRIEELITKYQYLLNDDVSNKHRRLKNNILNNDISNKYHRISPHIII